MYIPGRGTSLYNFLQQGGSYGSYPAYQPYGGRAGTQAPGTISQPLTSSNGGGYAQNVVNLASRIGGGWRFTGNALGEIIGPTSCWQQGASGGSRYLQIRDGVKPSDAINELFTRPGSFQFDCATSTVAVLQKARLETIGVAAFNNLYANNPLVLAGWTDTSGTNLSMDRQARLAAPGQYSLNGRSTISGDLAPFDADVGDKLIPGSVYYFERPGDTSTYNQGWNAIFLGRSGDSYQFWRVQDGVHSVNIREYGRLLVDIGGMYNSEYLSSSILTPDISNLSQIAQRYWS